MTISSFAKLDSDHSYSLASLPSLGSRIIGFQGAARRCDDRSSGGVSRRAGRPNCALGRRLCAGDRQADSVIDGVGEAMTHLLIDFAVDVGLKREHVCRLEPVAALQHFVDALDAIRVGPLVA